MLINIYVNWDLLRLLFRYCITGIDLPRINIYVLSYTDLIERDN